MNYTEIRRSKWEPKTLSRVPIINALDDENLIRNLNASGLNISPEPDIDWKTLTLRPGDTLYVPCADLKKLEKYRTCGWPKRGGVAVSRYVFAEGDKSRATEDTKELYPWARHNEKPSIVRLPFTPKLDTLSESDERTEIPLLDPDLVYFTADTHFFDQRVLKYRPRFCSIEEMNERLISNWNETVPENGIVFHLGDLMKGGLNDAMALLPLLNGKILLVKGNHDNQDVFRSKELKAISKLVLIGKQRRLTLERRRMDLNHYPFLCYAGQYNDVWQLFGHVHSGSEGGGGFDAPRLSYLLPFQYDVGVDNNADRPISFRQLCAIMDRRKVEWEERGMPDTEAQERESEEEDND
ncbi:MAG: metallophosphoesterase [Bacteroidales bacterium]|nr:metallophosphoesterase [Bacteroidales bacterium]